MPLIKTLVPRSQLLDRELGMRAIQERLGRLHEPHIAPLTRWVEARRDFQQIKGELGVERCEWLRAALERCHPDHPWLALL